MVQIQFIKTQAVKRFKQFHSPVGVQEGVAVVQALVYLVQQLRPFQKNVLIIGYVLIGLQMFVLKMLNKQESVPIKEHVMALREDLMN